MNRSPHEFSKVLLHSLIDAPRLVGDLPEAKSFDLQSLARPELIDTLNFSQKLGHICEDALALLLNASPRYAIMERNFQIQKGAGPTLGELDFLLLDRKSGTLIHMELAVKFFLAVEDSGGLQLPGPNAADSYFRKLAKMRSHQLVLSVKYRDQLPPAYRKKAIKVRQLVHGCIFDHVDARQPAIAPYLEPEGRRGKWLHLRDCPGYFNESTLLEVIPKPLWPVPLDKLKGLSLERWEPTAKLDRCLMLRAGQMPQPYFITPDGYPKSAKARRAGMGASSTSSL